MTYTFVDLQKWVSEWEGPALEFKLKVEEKVGKSISAFANTYGGIIVFGVDPKTKELKGVSNPDEESRRLRQTLDQCKPFPKTEQQFIRHENKTCIVLKVEPVSYSQTPCFYNKTCFMRQGTTNLEFAGEELIALLQNRAILNFEESHSHSAISDLDTSKIEALLKARNPTATINLANETELKRALTAIGIANWNGEFFLKNAATLLFAKDPWKFHSNLEVRIVRFKGKELTIDSLDFDRRLNGTIPELVENTYQTVLEKIGRSYRIEGLKRNEIPDYPPEALREAITNALGHRDYSDKQEVRIEIFSDRLRITNPGGLMPGQTIENFDKVLRHRNPIIYRLLHDLRLGEGLGSGIDKMRKKCRQQNLPDPDFHAVSNSFQVTFYNATSDRKNHPLDFENVRQKQAIAYLQKHATLKTAEYAKIVDISLPTAVKDLNELVNQNKLKKVGKYRGAHYILAENFK